MNYIVVQVEIVIMKIMPVATAIGLMTFITDIGIRMSNIKETMKLYLIMPRAYINPTSIIISKNSFLRSSFYFSLLIVNNLSADFCR